MKLSNLSALSAFALLCSPLISLAQEKGNDEIPACHSIDGKKVVVALASEEYLRTQAYTKLALSLTGNDGTPVILLDGENLSKLSEQFQKFVFFHECAHHELGHVTLDTILKEKTLRKSDLDRELDADCKAVQRLVKDAAFSYSRDDINLIMESMTKELGASSVKKDANGKVIKKGMFKYYMPIEERNALLLQCFEKASLEKSDGK